MRGWEDDDHAPDIYHASIEGKFEDLQFLIDSAWPVLPFIRQDPGYTNVEPHENWRSKSAVHGQPMPGHVKFPADSPWSHRILVIQNDPKQFTMVMKLYGGCEMSEEEHRTVQMS